MAHNPSLSGTGIANSSATWGEGNNIAMNASQHCQTHRQVIKMQR